MKFLYIGIIVGVILVTMLLWGFYAYPCVKFVPLRLDDRGFENTLVPAVELVDSEYLKNIQIVLYYYGETFRIDNNMNLFITWRLFLNKELVWNYSTKASNKSLVKSIEGKRLGD